MHIKLYTIQKLHTAKETSNKTSSNLFQVVCILTIICQFTCTRLVYYRSTSVSNRIFYNILISLYQHINQPYINQLDKFHTLILYYLEQIILWQEDPRTTLLFEGVGRVVAGVGLIRTDKQPLSLPTSLANFCSVIWCSSSSWLKSYKIVPLHFKLSRCKLSLFLSKVKN